MDWEDKRTLFNEYVKAYREENEMPLGRVCDDLELPSSRGLVDMSRWVEGGEEVGTVQILNWNRSPYRGETFEEHLQIRGRRGGNGSFLEASLGWESVLVFDRLCRRPALLARPDLALRIHELV